MDTLELSELIDIKKLNQLIGSDQFNIDIQTKKQLTKYKKLIRNNKVCVSYKFGYGGDRGRIFAKESLSLQMFWRPIRHTLSGHLYEDIDIVNAHPTILKQICDKKAWKCDQLSDYIENRESLLTQIQKHFNIDRDAAKKGINAIINGGNGFNDSIDFIKLFKEEMKCIRDNLANSEPELVKYVSDKRRKIKKDDFNLNGKVLNIKLCVIENDILLEMVKFFRSKDLTIGVLCFDGLMLEKNIKITDELLYECCKYINEKTGFSIKLQNKPMDQGFDLSVFDKDDYDNVKIQFEKDCVKINQADCFIKTVDGERLIINTKSLYHRDGNLDCYIFGEKKKFIPKWILDPNIKTYEKIDFLPHPLVCNDNVYNMFTGLEGSSYIINKYDEQQIEPILNHIRKLSGNDPNSFSYFIKWLADMAQNPGRLNGISIVLRSNEGAGKNIFLDFIGKKIIGASYYFTTADPNQLFGRFAIGKKNKILINLDETSGYDGFKYSEMIKNFITSETTDFEQKGVQTITVRNFSRWVFTTNNSTPVKVGLTDRRFVIFDCDNSMCKNDDYFKELYKCFNDDNKCGIFYKYLMNIDLSDWSPINDRPITEAYKDIQSSNIPVIYQFLDIYIQSITTLHGRKTVAEVYTAYKLFCENNGYECKLNTLSIGREFSKIDGIKKEKNNNIRGYSFNVSLVNKFLSKYLD